MCDIYRIGPETGIVFEDTMRHVDDVQTPWTGPERAGSPVTTMPARPDLRIAGPVYVDG